jgi:hypothetical protein
LTAQNDPATPRSCNSAHTESDVSRRPSTRKPSVVRLEVESFSKTGVVWRAYEEDGTPMYLGAETLEACRARILEFHPTATLEVAPLTDNQRRVLEAYAGNGPKNEEMPDGTWWNVVRNELVALRLLEERVVGGGHRRLFPSEMAKTFLPNRV